MKRIACAAVIAVSAVICGSALPMLAATPAWAGDIEDCDNAEALIRTDPARAVAACRRLAGQGDAIAQYNLGLMYYNGRGILRDYAEAVRWYRKAADQGDADAQNNLGAMYHDGQGVPQDYAEAVRWFRKAADQGHTDAQSNLGLMYKYGRGVPRDHVAAYIWFNLAAAGWPAYLGENVAASARDGIAASMTPQQIATAQRRSAEWRPHNQ